MKKLEGLQEKSNKTLKDKKANQLVICLKKNQF
jgi:hypothetical protein